jgi:hypothetical protein
MSFYVDHTSYETLVNENGPVNGLTARITTPDDAATQTAISNQFYSEAAAHGANIIRLDVVAGDVGRTIEQQIPYIQQAVKAAEAAGLGVQLEFSQGTLTFDAQESKAAWSILAPMFANDPNVVYEEANEPAWVNGYNSQLLDGLAEVYHVMRAAAPNKPIAVLDFPTIQDAGTPLDAIHGLEARGVDFSGPVTVAWHGYYNFNQDAVQQIRDAGYAMQMTEITDAAAPGVLAQVHAMHMTGFDLAGGFGMTNPDPQNDPYGAYLDTFLNYTEPTLHQLGVDWQAHGTATASASTAPSVAPAAVPASVVTPSAVATPAVTTSAVTPSADASTPVVVPSTELLHFTNQTEAHTVAGYTPGATISFDGYGPGATLTHEVGGAADEYRVGGPNGFDTLTLPGVTDLASVHYLFA